MNRKIIGVVGLGYVGLPLAVEFGKIRPVVGFDLNLERVIELRGGVDRTLEVESSDLSAAVNLTFTSQVDLLQSCSIFIIAVPTPIDNANRPNLIPLIRASETVGNVMRRGALVIYESTVYPGATEEICVPVLESTSGLKYNRDFFCGYSPERVNPGDKHHRLPSIRKVTSGSTPEVAKEVDKLYADIITAGTFRAGSIRVAEAAKVIENTQRDLNIALMNELAIIFQLMKIDTMEVLEAAASKWNFIPFRPGLVGGHCIGVDPYYLTHKAQELGYHPAVILAGRRTNDGMAEHVAKQVVKLMAMNSINVVGSRVLVLGLAFKENCPDLRNTKVVDVIAELRSYNAYVDVYDPWISLAEAEIEYNISPLVHEPNIAAYDAIILAVGHQQFAQWGVEKIRSFGKEIHILYDVKSLLPKLAVDGRL